MSVSDIEFRTVYTKIRPPRIALFIDRSDPDWQTTCIGAIAFTTSLWGGWYSCLIPTDGDTVASPFRRILSAFDPDYLLNYQATGADLLVSDIAAFDVQVENEIARRSIPPGLPEELTRAARGAARGAVLKSVRRPAIRLHDDLFKGLLKDLTPFQPSDYNADTAQQVASGSPFGFASLSRLTHLRAVLPSVTDRPRCTLIDARGDAMMRLMVYSMTGVFSPNTVPELERMADVSTETWPMEGLGGYLNGLWSRTPLANDKLPGSLSLALCTVSAPYISSKIDWTPVVVVGDTMDDVCLAHDLYRLRHRVFWLPLAALDRFVASAVNHNVGENEIVSQIAFNAAQPGSRITLLSCSLQPKELGSCSDGFSSVLDGLGVDNVQIGIAHDVGPTLAAVNTVLESGQPFRSEKFQFYRGVSVPKVDTPRPKRIPLVPTDGFNWITDVWIENQHLPRSPGLAPEAIRCPNYGTNEVRISQGGYSYLCPNIVVYQALDEPVLVRPELHILSPSDVFGTVFGEAGWQLRESDKGLYHLECLAKFVSMSVMASFFAEEFSVTVLGAYTSKPTGNDYVYLNGRSYLSYLSMRGVVSKLFVQGAPEADADYQCRIDVETDMHVRSLLRHSVIYRGFIFKCEFCKHADWYAVDVVGQEFQCSRCRWRQIYTRDHWREPNEPQWYYQLDEIVYQAYTNDVHVPVLALNALRLKAQGSFIYLPEAELWHRNKQDKPHMEIDMIFCSNGKLGIGEAKTCERLADTDKKERAALEKYRDVADRVGADTIVLATYSRDWRAATREKAEEILGPQRVRFLVRSDLDAAARSEATSKP
jgi:hypothetical protein